MADEWFYAAAGTEYGPVDASHLQQLALAGQIYAGTPIRKGRNGQWVLAQTVTELFIAPPPVPPVADAAALLPPHVLPSVAPKPVGKPMPIPVKRQVFSAPKRDYLKAMGGLHKFVGALCIVGGIIGGIVLLTTGEEYAMGSGLFLLCFGPIVGIVYIAFAEAIEALVEVEIRASQLQYDVQALADCVRWIAENQSRGEDQKARG